MKKILTLAMAIGVSSLVTACGGIPTCSDELDNCNRNAAYTEERTVKTHTTAKQVIAEEPTPVAVKAEPKPVIVEPAPAPITEPVVQKPIMQSAAPQFKHISKK